MPNSQIDMVVRDDDDGVGWKVCGEFEPQEGRPDRDVDLFVVVRQGDVVARGNGLVSTRDEWRLEVTPEGSAFVVGQPAIATAVAIAKEDPAGLEAFTWAQQIPVLEHRTDGNPPTQFAEPETVSDHGELAAGHSISSSLILKKDGAAAGDGRLVWQHELQIR
jgi:hypothetical protein